MRWILVLCLICVVLPFSWQAGRARSDDCVPGPDIHVTVTPLFGNPVYDFSNNLPAIQLMANESVHKVRQGWAIGLTQYEPVLEMTAPISVSSTPEGLFCARPVSVDVAVGYKDMIVSIPRELSGDSCGFEKILQHEDEHIAVSQQVLKKYLPLVRDKFDAYLKLNESVREKTPKDAVALQQNMLRATLDGIAEQMSEETDALQWDVDRPEEYHRLLGACNGELADLVKSARSEQMLAQGF